MPVKVMGSWGWDGARKRYVRADRDSVGGWFAPTGTIEGDNLVWSGEFASPMMPPSPARHTFTKKSDKEFVHALELTIDGKPTPIFEATCKK